MRSKAKPKEPVSTPGSLSVATYCDRCKTKRYVSNGRCLCCRAKVKL